MESTPQVGLLGPLLLARGVIDRSAPLRGDSRWRERVWTDPATRVVVVGGGQAPVRRSGQEVRLVTVSPAEAPEGERYLLGVDAEGVAYFAVVAPPVETARAEAAGRGAAPLALAALPEGLPVVTGLRQVATLLGDLDAGLLVYAVALEAWHATHEFCPRCGSRTEVRAGGHMRVCPEDGSQHFPRVDPAVIMLVHDGEDRCLLARGPQWPRKSFSVLAGFVEPGESLEHAVVREVAEEVGVRVTDPRYLASQPWPFPRSLMLGFSARAVSTEFVLDPEEIAEARWFGRAELCDALKSGEVRLPSEVSIARRLIETWYGGPLTGDW